MNPIIGYIASIFDVVSYEQLYTTEDLTVSDMCVIKFNTTKTFSEIMNLLTETDCEIVSLIKYKLFWELTLDYLLSKNVKKIIKKKRKVKDGKTEI
jgi:DNA-binding transcriptional regulator of glucitol operon